MRGSGDPQSKGEPSQDSRVTPAGAAQTDLAGRVLAERFEVVRRLGAGGMGVVFEARDRERNASVALKTLSRLDPSAIYRMKNEFRSLADVVHPNLVRLHELHADGDLWFFTMDLVRGRSFVEHVRVDPAVGFEDTAAVPDDAMASGQTMAIPGSPGAWALREASLRRALLELGRGVDAIHRAGKIHRDLKPSNVLVSRSGHVVILDFGLVSDQRQGGVGQTIADGSVSGTPSYMAPEQCDWSAEVTPASDWYSVGVMLFEALTGALPFQGSARDVIIAKQHRNAPAPAEVARDVPDDLNQLCVELLCRVPADRVAPSKVLERLEAVAGSEANPALSRRPEGALELPFAGRKPELAALAEALRATDNGKPVLALVHGDPGMGKSMLVERFLGDLAASDQAVVLSGRCYERESVPFKLLDGVVDALSRHLRRLPAIEAARLLPRHVHALARLFPVLSRVDAIASMPQRPLPPDPIVLRRRAAASLTELLARLTDEQPLVVYVDDLHWGDSDGARLLVEVLTAQEAPSALVIATYRTREGELSASVQALAESKEIRERCVVRELPLGPLDDDAVSELVRATAPEAGLDASLIRRDSEGNPYLVAELVRHAMTAPSDAEPTTSGYSKATPTAALERLSAALLARIVQLEPNARLCLQLLAVAACPISERLLAAAADLGDALPAALSALRSTQLARTTEGRSLVPYHDRIREAVTDSLAPEPLRSRHAALAEALETLGSEDWEALATHHEGAGNTDKAFEFAVRAANRAIASLAHGRAVELYERALRLQPGAPSRREIGEQLGDALVAVGRGTEAATRYVECVPGASAEEASRLRIQAATQLLLAGHIEMGVEGVQEALAGLGIRWPADAAESWQEIDRVLGGLRRTAYVFTPRTEADISPAVLARIDACWTAGLGLWIVDADAMRSLWFLLRAYQDALETGEPLRIARSAYYQAAASAINDPTSPDWAYPDSTLRVAFERDLSVGDRAAALCHDPRVDMWRQRTLGYHAHFTAGRPAEAVTAYLGALEVAGERCSGVAREIGDIRFHCRNATWLAGQVREAHRLALQWGDEARSRGDLYGEISMRGFNIGYLFDDDPDLALDHLDEARARWSRGEDYLWWLDRLMRTDVLRYAGRAVEAFPSIQALWAWTLENMLALCPLIRAQVAETRARVAIAVAHAISDPALAKESLSECIDELGQSGLFLYAGHSQYLRAELALLDGDEAGARALAEPLIEQFDDANDARRTAVRMRLGEIIGGEWGARVAANAETALRACGIANPARWRPGPSVG